jgi:hypothetical protein
VILAAPVVASLRVLGEYLLVKLFDQPRPHLFPHVAESEASHD